MLMFELILVLLLDAVVLTNLAKHLAAPYPSLLAIAVAGLAFPIPLALRRQLWQPQSMKSRSLPFW
jgi:hypothetical protein